ncbi:hypothetical protein [Clostridium sp. D33t1_170424_F3]|nr:hypothetical protein [Clostridium sp. D33t1_170424_F3]
MRINRYIAVKYGSGKKYDGKELMVGGKKYVQYSTLADLRKDFPDAK